MSTRTNIVVQYGRTKVYLYRHHDGYPGETGADLIEKLRAAGRSPEKLLVSLLTAEYEATTYCGPRPIYEITNNLHGDIEWIYLIEVGGDPKVAAAKRPFGEDPALILRSMAPGPLSALVARVNSDRQQMNRRMEQLKRDNPGSVYADCDPYPMLAETTESEAA